jgi:hypothetical protein
VHTLQAADLIDYKIVAQLSSLQGLMFVGIFFFVDSLVDWAMPWEMRRAI